MCGIAGWYSWGNQRPDAGMVRGLLLANMERGTSATGMAWLSPSGKIRIRKAEGPADAFIKAQSDGLFNEVASSPRALLHARATTKGSEKENANNHPVFGLGWLAVHNGTINNDDDLWKYYTKTEGVKRFAEVDTSAIPLLLSRGKDVKSSLQYMSLMSGSATIAAWNSQQVDQMVLGRFGHNDLYMFLDEVDQILYWSSSSAASYLMPGRRLGRHKFVTLSKLSEDYTMVLTPEGIDAVQVYKVTRNPFVWRRKEVERTYPATETKTETGSRSNAQKSLPMRSMNQTTDTGGRLDVTFPNPTPMLAVTKVSWEGVASNNIPTLRPTPLYEVLDYHWHSLTRMRYLIGRMYNEEKPQKDVLWEVPTGYGRWAFPVPAYELNKDPEIEKILWDRSFYPYKRTKGWFRVAYRLNIQLPAALESPTDAAPTSYTQYDGHLVWETYNQTRLTIMGQTSMSLGFMCPWCGVWSSSIDIQDSHGYCDFCRITSDLPGRERKVKSNG
jgi:hypothetical protein